MSHGIAGSGIEATAAVLKEAPEANVLVLSMQDDPRYVREAFEAGASGYVLKEAADTEVVGAVRTVASGERYVHPETFAMFEAQAQAMGFRHAAVGALVRSSYHADRQAHDAGVA